MIANLYITDLTIPDKKEDLLLKMASLQRKAIQTNKLG